MTVIKQDLKTEALKLALAFIDDTAKYLPHVYDAPGLAVHTAIRKALADIALDRMAENARELGLDYEPHCKTGSQCTSKCQQCEQPAQQREPHGWYINGYGAVLGASEPKSVRPGEWLPFYTSTLANKPWEGLTDAEFQWIYDNGRTPAGMMELVEAKLKEKNA